MEGGILPWRVQDPSKDGVVYATYDKIMDPLPPPPDGLKWAKTKFQGEDGVERTRWELVETQPSCRKPEDDDELPHAPLSDPDFIEHVVMPTDTVSGLRLRYKVTMPELRKHNDFCGESFQLCDVLRIPIAGREAFIMKRRQKLTKEVLRQRFRQVTRCECDQMVEYYLDSNSWALREALADYREDKTWEEEHAAELKAAASRSRAAASVPTHIPTSIQSAPLASLVQPPNIPPPRYRSIFPLGKRSSSTAPAGTSTSRAMQNFVADVFSTTSTSSVRTPLLRDYDDRGMATPSRYPAREGEEVLVAMVTEGAPLLGQPVRMI